MYDAGAWNADGPGCDAWPGRRGDWSGTRRYPAPDPGHRPPPRPSPRPHPASPRPTTISWFACTTAALACGRPSQSGLLPRTSRDSQLPPELWQIKAFITPMPPNSDRSGSVTRCFLVRIVQTGDDLDRLRDGVLAAVARLTCVSGGSLPPHAVEADGTALGLVAADSSCRGPLCSPRCRRSLRRWRHHGRDRSVRPQDGAVHLCSQRKIELARGGFRGGGEVVADAVQQGGAPIRRNHHGV